MPIKEGWVRRKELLASARSYSHVHLGAPDGFGKTTLLNLLMHYFMRSGRGARSGKRFNGALDLKVFDGVAEFLRSPPKGRVFLAVDNLKAQDMEFLRQTVIALPENIRIFSAGSPLPPSWSLLKLEKKTLELGMEELSFTEEEASRFVEPRIFEATGGWPALCRLSAGMTPSAFQASLTRNGGIAGWMYATFLAPLSIEKRQFLLSVSPLDFLDPELCDVLGERMNSVSLLSVFFQEGLPLFSKEGFVFHRAFADFLRKELSALKEGPAVWRRAVKLYSEHGKYDQALRCAIETRDAEWLVKAVENGMFPGLVNSLAKGVAAGLKGQLEAVRIRGGVSSPRMLTLMSQHLYAQGDFEGARRMSDIAVQMLRSSSDDQGLVRATVVCAQILRNIFRIEDSNALLEQIEEERPDLPLSLRYALVAEQAVNRVQSTQFKMALAGLEKLNAAAKAAKDEEVQFLCRYLMTAPNFYLGRYSEALECFTSSKNFSPYKMETTRRHKVTCFAVLCHQLQGREGTALTMLEERIKRKTTDFLDNHWWTYGLAWEVEFGRQRLCIAEGDVPDFSLMKTYAQRASECALRNSRNIFFMNLTKIWNGLTEIYLDMQNTVKAQEIAKEIVPVARSVSPLYLCMVCNRLADYFANVSPSGTSGTSGENMGLAISLYRECVVLAQAMESEIFSISSSIFLGALCMRAGLKDSARVYFAPAFKSLEREDLVGLFALFPKAPLFEAAHAWGFAPRFMKRMETLYSYSHKKMTVRLFGDFALSAIPEGEPLKLHRRKTREFLAFLLIHNREGSPRDVILKALWPTRPAKEVLPLFYAALAQVRREFAKRGLKVCIDLDAENRYRIDTAELSVDWDLYLSYEQDRELAELLAEGEPDERKKLLQEEFVRYRVAPFRLPLLADIEAPWVDEARKKIGLSRNS